MDSRKIRFAVQARLLEFPVGTLEAGEDPLESMQRELGEEAGYSAARHLAPPLGIIEGKEPELRTCCRRPTRGSALALVAAAATHQSVTAIGLILWLTYLWFSVN